MRPKKFVKCHFNLSVSSFGARRASPVRESHEEGARGNEVGWFHTLGRAGWVLHSELPNVMSALHVRPFFGGSLQSQHLDERATLPRSFVQLKRQVCTVRRQGALFSL